VRCCSPGGDSGCGQLLLVGSCDVIAESRRAPVQLSSGLQLRHCDVTAASRYCLLMTSLDQRAAAVNAIQSGPGFVMLLTFIYFIIISTAFSALPSVL